MSSPRLLVAVVTAWHLLPGPSRRPILAKPQLALASGRGHACKMQASCIWAQDKHCDYQTKAAVHYSTPLVCCHGLGHPQACCNGVPCLRMLFMVLQCGFMSVQSGLMYLGHVCGCMCAIHVECGFMSGSCRWVHVYITRHWWLSPQEVQALSDWHDLACLHSMHHIAAPHTSLCCSTCGCITHACAIKPEWDAGQAQQTQPVQATEHMQAML